MNRPKRLKRAGSRLPSFVDLFYPNDHGGGPRDINPNGPDWSYKRRSVTHLLTLGAVTAAALLALSARADLRSHTDADQRESRHADHDDDRPEHQRPVPLATGQLVTPTSIDGAVQQYLNPRLTAYPHFVAGEAVRSQLSPAEKEALAPFAALWCTEMARKGQRFIAARDLARSVGPFWGNQRPSPEHLAHSVARPEVALRTSDDLSVGRMIRAFDTDDPWFESAFVRVQVFEKFELR